MKEGAVNETTTRTEELRRLAEKATGTQWAVSGEIQGEAPAVVLHAEDVADLLDVVNAAESVVAWSAEKDGKATLPAGYITALRSALASLNAKP